MFICMIIAYNSICISHDISIAYNSIFELTPDVKQQHIYAHVHAHDSRARSQSTRRDNVEYFYSLKTFQAVLTSLLFDQFYGDIIFGLGNTMFHVEETSCVTQ